MIIERQSGMKCKGAFARLAFPALGLLLCGFLLYWSLVAGNSSLYLAVVAGAGALAFLALFILRLSALGSNAGKQSDRGIEYAWKADGVSTASMGSTANELPAVAEATADMKDLEKMSTEDLRKIALAHMPDVRIRGGGQAGPLKAFFGLAVLAGLASYLYQTGNVQLAFMFGLFAFAGVSVNIVRMRRARKEFLVLSEKGLRGAEASDVIPWEHVDGIETAGDGAGIRAGKELRGSLRQDFSPRMDGKNSARIPVAEKGGGAAVAALSFEKKRQREEALRRIALYRNAALARAELRRRGERI